MAQRHPIISDPIFEDPNCHESICGVLSEQRYGPTLSVRNKMYYRVRPFLPLWLRKYLQRVTRPKGIDKNWFIDTELLDAYAALFEEGESREIINFWPGENKWGLVFTHDVETSEGFTNIEVVAKLEEKYGFRSSWNLVACKYPIDIGYVNELKSRGFEIGVHGYNHDGKDYFSKKIFGERAKYVNEAIAAFSAVGYRSPAAHRNLEWLQMLNIKYDSSCFDVDPYQPMPGGTKSIWPFVVGKFVEIPYTLPQDHVLFTVLKEDSNEIWKKKTNWLIDQHGLVCLITHPDYLVNKRWFNHYENYLAFVREKSDYWHGTPAALAEWWLKRHKSKVANKGRERSIEGPVGESGRILKMQKKSGKIVFVW